jgi:nitroreductase
MESSKVMLERRSIRAFTSDPVPESVVREILEEARWAPSWGNAQDWEVFVVTGDALGRLKDGLQKAAESGAAQPADIAMPLSGAEVWPDHIASRMTYRRPSPEVAAALPERAGLWSVYNAQVLLLFTIDERLAPEYACFDSGLVVENVCLAAVDRGLGTCIMAMVVRFPEALREVVPAEGRRFVIAVALGHADETSPLNALERRRADFDEIVHWVS